MKVFTTMGSKRNKGKRGFTLIELLIVMVILAILAGVVVMAVGNVFGSAKERAYTTIKPQIQNAVTAYMVENNGQKPPNNGSFAIEAGGATVTVSALDICSLVGEGQLMRQVPDGCFSGTVSGNVTHHNFWNASAYGAGCAATGADQHYVWVIDNVGNVYSTCINTSAGACDDIETDGWMGEDAWP